MRSVWIVSAALVIAATAAFAIGTDDWHRSLHQPNADGAYYYAYLPTLVLDRDLDFDNQYEVTKNWYRLGKTPTGRTGNVFGVGPAVFELPVFVAGHLAARATGARGDGFSTWETTFVLWTSIPASLGALLLAYRLACRRVGAGSAYAGALLAAVAGPLLYYAVRQPGYAHPFAALFATLLVERWDASYKGDAPRTLRTWLVLGAAAGAAALARPQLAIWWLLLPAAGVDDLRRRGTVACSQLIARWAAAAGIALVVFAPQLLVWKALYGAWYIVPQGEGFMRWDAPAWSETLFSSRNGLFPWAPLYAPMLVGLVVLARRELRLPLALLLGLLGQALANGATWDWWGGGSFGGRRFDSTYVVFAVGAAVLVDIGLRAVLGLRIGHALRSRIAGVLGGLALAAAILVALATIELAARTSVVSARTHGGEAASRIWRTKIGGVRGWLAAQLSGASTAPIRMIFAWRHDVDVDAYDRMVGVNVLGETFPGLNSFADKRRDKLQLDVGWTTGLARPRPDGRAVTVDPRVQLRFGINRRGTVTARIYVEATGTITARWNGVTVARDGTGLVELTAEPTRGMNTIELAAPVGAVVSAIDLEAALSPAELPQRPDGSAGHI
ncbi:MAG: hypothetical protein ABIY55_07080 [Kofleriaceae bacterium]